MKNRFCLIIVLFILVAAVSLSGDDAEARVSVVPFSHSLEVLQNDAEKLSSLFETALIRTGSYIVVKQSELGPVLEAQAASLQDFADKEYAVEVGKIISADHVFVGDVMKLGRSYVVSIQLVDVEQGKAVIAESAEATDLESFVGIMGILAETVAESGTAGSPVRGSYYNDADRRDMYVSIGDRFSAMQRYDAAIKQYERALDINEFDVDVHWRIVTAKKKKLLMDSLYSNDAVTSGIDAALRNDQAGFRLVAKEAVEDALENLYTIQAIDPLLADDCTLLLDEAEFLKMESDFSNARQVLARAARIYPENPFVLAEYGLLLAFNPEDDAAWREGTAFIRRALAISPETALFHLYLGRSLQRKYGLIHADALRAYRRTAERAAGNDFWLKRIRSFGYYGMQRIFYRLGAEDDGILSLSFAMPYKERLDNLLFLRDRGIRFSSSSRTQNMDYYLAQLLLEEERYNESVQTMFNRLDRDPEKWRSSEVIYLELIEKALSRSGENPDLLSTVRRRIQSFR
jgi:tetratricopeptide (TPR) repeat protein